MIIHNVLYIIHTTILPSFTRWSERLCSGVSSLPGCTLGMGAYQAAVGALAVGVEALKAVKASSDSVLVKKNNVCVTFF